MIELNVMDICHECSKFEPRVLEGCLYAQDRVTAFKKVIVCEHDNECRNMMKFLKKEMMKTTDK